jgi:hypothetical protein
MPPWARGSNYSGHYPVMLLMHSANYYRGQAAKARWIARDVATPTAADLLETVAEDYDDIAEDLENGAVSIRHPELMKQPGRKR